MKILLVGGKFNKEGGKPSGLVSRIGEALEQYCRHIAVYNGGSIEDLSDILVAGYDAVLWWPDIPNFYPKDLMDVKSRIGHATLVMSKNNLCQPTTDGTPYSPPYTAQGLVAKGLKAKANLMVIFEGNVGAPPYCMKLMDPLGNAHSETTFDVDVLAGALAHRLTFLQHVSRVPSRIIGDACKPADDPEFFDVVRRAADEFHRLLDPGPDVQRLLGNASFRCAHGFPAVRQDNGIYVSRRNVDKRDVSADSFVRVKMMEVSGVPIMGYYGDNSYKPSVDAPIQARLFDAFPNIKYMIHGHVYASGGDEAAKMTS
ncbi:MAG: class II aldolase/adducin family protein, partial [bacterium]